MPALPVSLLIGILAFLVAIDVHEFSHAFVANTQGDVTAKQLGRLSLNPIRHLDPMGTLLLLIMIVSGFGIGWGKPVPVNPVNLRNGRLSMALVSAAGVTANLITAVACGLVIRMRLLERGTLPDGFVRALLLISVGLAVFNLLPVFPLDGFNVAVNVLPQKIASKLAQYAHWGPGILMLLIFLPQFLPGFIPGVKSFNVLALILEPPTDFILRAILGG